VAQPELKLTSLDLNTVAKPYPASLVKLIENNLNSSILTDMTKLEEQVMKLPKLQKVSLMEKIWADFSQEGDPFEPPEWHARELEETERRVEEGKEHFEDWNDAKRKLRES
jgi:hypothetical protein